MEEKLLEEEDNMSCIPHTAAQESKYCPGQSAAPQLMFTMGVKQREILHNKKDYQSIFSFFFYNVLFVLNLQTT